MSDWFFDPLKMFSYDVAVVDPPTEFTLYSEAGNEKSASRHYKTVPWPELEKLPVGHMMKANGILLLWACPPTLPKSIRLMEAWGALYKTELVWRKITKNHKPRMGPGYRARGFHESVLMGVFGDERQIHDTFPGLFDGLEDPRDGVMFDGVAREHSRKPDEFYEMVRHLTPGANRCDLFSRQNRSGFDGWGDEHGKFDQPTKSLRPLPETDAAILDDEQHQLALAVNTLN
jgi:N6-adenosine-specific RNA methylase IME4